MKKTKARYIITVFMLLSAVGLLSCSAKQQSAESGHYDASYDTPEKAVSVYLEGFKNMDLEQMMSTFAIASYVDEYDFEGQIERIRGYSYNLEVKLPNATPLARDLNMESRRSSISSSILKQYVSLSSLKVSLADTQAFEDEKEAKEFAGRFGRNLEDVKTDTMKLLGFIPPEELSDIYAMDVNKKNIAKLAEIYGADEMVSCAAVFELDGETYLMCADTASYGGKWYLTGLGGNLGSILGIDSFKGGLLPLSGMDYDIDWKELMVPVTN